MRVALVGAEIEENLGLRYLAAALARAGHVPEVVAFDHAAETSEVARSLVDGDYDVIGMSLMFQLRTHEFVTLAERVRALGWRGVLVAGGQHATFMANEILADNPSFDAVVLGDGERPLVELVEALGTGGLCEVPGLVVRADDGAIVATEHRHDRTDLTELAMPVRAPTPKRHMGLGVAPMVASRGCYASCTFCSIVAWEKLSGGPKYRVRPPEHVAYEMARLYHERGVRIFNFHDDNFWFPRADANRARLDELANALAREGVGDIALLFKSRPNDVDERLFARARDMGMVRVYVGIETDAPAGLVALRRGVSQPQNQRALDVLTALDVHACSNLLLFDPDTRLGDVAHNIDFLERNEHVTLNFCRVEPYGGTPLTHKLAAEGRLLGSYLGFDYRMRDERVELLWRLVHLAFHERNFPSDGLANDMIALVYRFHLAKRFWPTAELEAFRDPVLALVRRFNRSQAALLRRGFDFTSRCDLQDRNTIVDFASELAVSVRNDDVPLRAECTALERALEAYAKRHGKGGSDGRLGEGAAGSGWWHAQRNVALGFALVATIQSAPALADPAPQHKTIAGSSRIDWTTTDKAVLGTITKAAKAAKQSKKGDWTIAGSGVSATIAFNEVYTGGGQCQVASLSGYAMTVTLSGAQAGDYELDAVGSTIGASADSLYRSADGRTVHVTIGNPWDTPSQAGIVWKHKTKNVRFVAAAPVPRQKPPEPERHFMGCDPAPEPTLPAQSLNAERAVHIGTPATSGFYGGTATSGVIQISLATWLDNTVHGKVSDPTVTVDAGTATISPAQPGADGPTASISYDARLPDGRVASGRHTLRVTWQVTTKKKPAKFVGTIQIEVSKDGVVTVLGKKHSSLDPRELPLRLRFAGTIDMIVEGPTHRLIARVPPGIEPQTFSWQASGGQLEGGTDGATVRYRPSGPAGVVTCVIGAAGDAIGIATLVRG